MFGCLARLATRRIRVSLSLLCLNCRRKRKKKKRARRADQGSPIDNQSLSYNPFPPSPFYYSTAAKPLRHHFRRARVAHPTYILRPFYSLIRPAPDGRPANRKLAHSSGTPQIYFFPSIYPRYGNRPLCAAPTPASSHLTSLRLTLTSHFPCPSELAQLLLPVASTRFASKSV